MPEPAPVPAWVVWTNRAVLTLAGTTAAVMVADYAGASDQVLDVVLAAAIVLATVVGVALPHRPVPVLVAALFSMLGLALIPPAWLLSLVPPLLLTVVRRRHRREAAGGGPYGPRRPRPDTDEDATP